MNADIITMLMAWHNQGEFPDATVTIDIGGSDSSNRWTYCMDHLDAQRAMIYYVDRNPTCRDMDTYLKHLCEFPSTDLHMHGQEKCSQCIIEAQDAQKQRRR